MFKIKDIQRVRIPGRVSKKKKWPQTNLYLRRKEVELQKADGRTESGLEHLHLEHLNNFREPTRLTPDVWDPSKLFVVCYVVYQFEIVWDDFIKSSNFHF